MATDFQTTEVSSSGEETRQRRVPTVPKSPGILHLEPATLRGDTATRVSRRQAVPLPLPKPSRPGERGPVPSSARKVGRGEAGECRGGKGLGYLSLSRSLARPRRLPAFPRRRPFRFRRVRQGRRPISPWRSVSHGQEGGGEAGPEWASPGRGGDAAILPPSPQGPRS